MQLFKVPPSHIDAAWRSGAHLLGEAAPTTDEWTPEQLKFQLARGEIDLLGASGKAWVAVRVLQFPNVRSLWVYAIYAPGAASRGAFEALEAYAKEQGCSRIQGGCGEAVARLWGRLGFKRAYEVMEYRIET